MDWWNMTNAALYGLIQRLESENAKLREQLKAGPNWKYPTIHNFREAMSRGIVVGDGIEIAFNAAREQIEGGK